MSGRCSTSSMNWALLTTPWWCSPATTALRCCPGPTAVPRRFAVKRPPTGKAVGESVRLAMARRHPSRAGHQRHRLAAGLHPDLRRRRGEPDLVEKVKKGYQIGDKTYRVHLDGMNMLPFLKGEEGVSARGIPLLERRRRLLALRVRRWKVVFAEQRHTGIAVWREPFSNLRRPKVFDLRADPFERGDASDKYSGRCSDRDFLLIRRRRSSRSGWRASRSSRPAPKAASFSIDKVVEQLMPKS